MNSQWIPRHLLLKCVAMLGLLAAMEPLVPAYAETSATNAGSQAVLAGDLIDLTLSEHMFPLDGRTAPALAFNGTIPGPMIRLKEGQLATLRVTNRLEERSSIHWHGLLLPPAMDGVPGVSFAGIEPVEMVGLTEHRPHARHLQHEPLYVIGRPDADAVATVKAQSQQTTCQQVNGSGELLIGQVPLLR